MTSGDKAVAFECSGKSLQTGLMSVITKEFNFLPVQAQTFLSYNYLLNIKGVLIWQRCAER
jgi:hypothetical protein